MAKENAKAKTATATNEEKPQRMLEIPLPEKIYDEILDSYAQMVKGKAIQNLQQQGQAVNEEQIAKITSEEVVKSVLRNQLLSAHERQIADKAIQDVKKLY